MDRATSGGGQHALHSGSGEPILIAEVEVDICGLEVDDCRVLLERGPEGDVIHLRHREYTGQDCSITLPAAPGTDRETAGVSLGRAVREGSAWIYDVIQAGVLDLEACQRIVDQAREAWRADRDAATSAAREADERSPSRIVAAARAAGLSPEPDGRRAHQWIASCPGGHHSIMLSTGSETFGCGYCKQKGGPDKLASFVARRRAR